MPYHVARICHVKKARLISKANLLSIVLGELEQVLSFFVIKFAKSEQKTSGAAFAFNFSFRWSKNKKTVSCIFVLFFLLYYKNRL